MTLVGWIKDEVGDGQSGWIRRMFTEGQRLRSEFGDDAVADLSIGQPLLPGKSVYDAFARSASITRPGRFGYMPNAGLPELRERCALDVGRADVTGDSIVITCGAAGAICVALNTFVPAGREIIGVAPYFPEFPMYARSNGCEFVAVTSLADGGLDLSGIERALSEKTAAVIINSPSNPSGYVITAQEMEALAGLLQRQAEPPLLIVDEVYKQFYYDDAIRIDPLDYYDNTVLVRSFSKDIGIAGERIGYLTLHPSLSTSENQRGLAICMRAMGFVNAPATAQLAMLDLASWKIELQPYQRRRDHFIHGLQQAGIEIVAPQGGIYAWFRSPVEDTLEFISELAKHRVLVTPGSAFGISTHVRACFSAPMRALDQTVESISALV